MRKSKLIAFVVSLGMVFSSIASLNVKAAVGDTLPLPAGHVFVDIAHNGNTIVAMSKPAPKYDSAILWCSEDAGKTWKNVREIKSALISSVPKSQQQLVYWQNKGIFVAHCAGTTLTSTDGKQWDQNKNLWTTANESIAHIGEQLLFAQHRKASATSDLTENKLDANKCNNMQYDYLKNIAAKPADSDGNISMLLSGQNRLVDVSLKVSNGVYKWSESKTKNVGNLPSMPYDLVYANGADQFFMVDGEKFFAIKDSQNYITITAADGEKAAGVGVNDKYIVVGTDTGKVYYTSNDAEVTAATVWTEIPLTGEADSTEPIKNIEFLDDGSFVALSNTQVYTGIIESYEPNPQITSVSDTDFGAKKDADGNVTGVLRFLTNVSYENADSTEGYGYMFVNIDGAIPSEQTGEIGIHSTEVGKNIASGSTYYVDIEKIPQKGADEIQLSKTGFYAVPYVKFASGVAWGTPFTHEGELDWNRTIAE